MVYKSIRHVMVSQFKPLFLDGLHKLLLQNYGSFSHEKSTDCKQIDLSNKHIYSCCLKLSVIFLYDFDTRENQHSIFW